MEVNYNNYRLEDFLKDANFVAWIQYPTKELEQFWTEWSASAPPNLAAFDEARETLTLIFSADRIAPSAAEEEEVLQKILGTINEAGEKTVHRKPAIKRWVIAAAAAAMLIISGAMWYASLQKEMLSEFTTAYGEMKKITLPDQSNILMNAHSSISFRPDWDNGDAREIWLKGEANFNVKHLRNSKTAVKDNERFIIHTSLLRVEVLGTVFNVKERRGIAEVSLESGSVEVQVKGEPDKQWLLKPNEVAIYNTTTAMLEKRSQDPLIYKAWTEKKMLANNTSVREIIQAIEDHYGHKVILEDPALANRTIDGTIPFKSENSVLFVLSNILEIDIERKDSTLVFKRRK
jgi:ferric-dicitrate binding protein FerR (iron transport regulator)